MRKPRPVRALVATLNQGEKMKTKILISALAAAALLGGCTQQARDQYDAAGSDVSKAAEHTGAAVSTDAKNTGQAVAAGAENAAATAKAAGEKAAADAKEAGAKAAQATDNAAMTGKVKTAITSASDLNVADLNVDTTGKTITLKGSVPTADQKKRADQIAKGIAGKDYTVDDQLTVGGGTTK